MQKEIIDARSRYRGMEDLLTRDQAVLSGTKQLTLFLPPSDYIAGRGLSLELVN